MTTSVMPQSPAVRGDPPPPLRCELPELEPRLQLLELLERRELLEPPKKPPPPEREPPPKKLREPPLERKPPPPPLREPPLLNPPIFAMQAGYRATRQP